MMKMIKKELINNELINNELIKKERMQNLPLLDLSKPICSPAKLNLLLSITGKRADGYHDLETIFQFISLYDELLFEESSSNKIEVIEASNQIAQEDNLIVKAIHLLKQISQAKGILIKQGIKITLTKHIPIGAGLGGGSSNAATTLIALNQLWNLNLTQAKLMRLGRSLGADVPIFIYGHSAFARGIGELLEPIELAEPYYLLIKPDYFISTALIFNHPDLKRDGMPINPQNKALHFEFYNHCEALVRVLYPEIDKMIQFLSQTHKARLTGTGSAFFAVCQSQQEAQNLLTRFSSYFTQQNYSAFIVKGLNRSPIFKFNSL